MTKEQLHEIVHAIGDESFVTTAFRVLAWFLPMAAACIPISPGRAFPDHKPATPREIAISAALFSIGALVLVSQKLATRSK